ncbi:Lysine methyltransferase protein [Dioscorea alata]|uniref:Lysine methyltransferase protein n=1 Tax=Dioscorea alata TaxID=55571 RepID=A0ACB7V4B7_DIOAL|nr:Lysine methyltransferase protein [Dioscorea alata]
MSLENVELARLKVIIHESEHTHDAATGRVLTGAWLWDSEIQLAHFLITRQLTNQTILELGAGTGLPGLIDVLVTQGFRVTKLEVITRSLLRAKQQTSVCCL